MEVQDSDLRGILEAARWAPSAFGEEPWRFIVARRGDPHRQALEETLMEGNAWAKGASLLIASLARENLTRNDRPNATALHDTGLATANLLAEATARGLITHPMSGFDKRRLKEAFGVPEGFTPVILLAVGHHDSELDAQDLTNRESRPRRRRSLAETVFGGVFGEAARL
jgi:nitroreductase